jgi:hypothetical protein
MIQAKQLSDRRDSHKKILALLDHAESTVGTGNSAISAILTNSTNRGLVNQLREEGNVLLKAAK